MLPAAGAPVLSATAEQIQRPAKALSPIPLWDTHWRVLVEARPGGAPLSRLEYRTRFLDQRPQTHAGSLDLRSAADEAVAGHVAVELPSRAHYERPFEVRLRVHDVHGAASDWVTVRFPPEKTIRPAAPDAYVISVDPLEGDYRIVGTVEYEASEWTTLATVREKLEQQARAAGGDAAVGFRLTRSTPDTHVFAADVIRYRARPRPTPTVVPRATDRLLGRVVIPYEAR